jgi:hypothetical protein
VERAQVAEEPAEPWWFELGASARAMSGLVPGPAVAGALGLTASVAALQLHLGGIWLPGVDTRVGARGESRFSVVLGELDVCGIAARPAHGSLAFCAGGQAGVIRGRASGLWMQRASQQPVVQAVPSARALLSVARWLSVQSAVGATVPLLFARYAYVDQAGQSHTYHSVEVGLWAELGVALRLGGFGR